MTDETKFEEDAGGCVLVGVLSLTTGIWMMYGSYPAWITLGIVCIVLVLLASKARH